MKKIYYKIFFSILFLAIFLYPSFVLADSHNQIKKFFVDPLYDIDSREQIQAVLKKISNKAYFYLEQDWYEGLEDKEQIEQVLEVLAKEFDQKIYPELTSFYGQEWRLGIDDDIHITILFHQMNKQVAGYFNFGDEYTKIQNTRSNEREMIYLNTDNILYEIIKSYIAHEFVHLISFNQKERLRGKTEEIWLNETRAEYAPTYLDYNQEYQDSNIKQRVKNFLESPSDSLCEWQNQKKDYGVINMFFHYLVDYYGENILKDSLDTSKTGIASLNYALEKNNIEKTFEDIFTDWAVAIFLNDCTFGEYYCYKNENLKNIRIAPSLIFLPSTYKTNVSLNYSIKPWSANWYRIIGVKGELKLEFKGDNDAEFKVVYILCKNSELCQKESLELDKNQEGEIILQDFDKDWTSLTLIPFIKSKTSGFNGYESSYKFSLSVSVEDKSQEELIAQLKARIAELQAQIAFLQAKITAILIQRGQVSCNSFSQNLYIGMSSSQVYCLQQFLESQGSDIYPQAIVSGFFGSLTQAAVIRFQEKYADEILLPLGLKKGTGFVGESTRQKINQLLQK